MQCVLLQEVCRTCCMSPRVCMTSQGTLMLCLCSVRQPNPVYLDAVDVTCAVLVPSTFPFCLLANRSVYGVQVVLLMCQLSWQHMYV